MAREETVRKVKDHPLRISHSKLDEAIKDDIDECLADLITCGIVNPDESDPMILAAIKHHAGAHFLADLAKAQECQERYDAHKACLMMASGYGGDHG